MMLLLLVATWFWSTVVTIQFPSSRKEKKKKRKQKPNFHWLEFIISGRAECRRLTDGYGDGSGAKQKIRRQIILYEDLFFFFSFNSYSFHSTLNGRYQSSSKSREPGDRRHNTKRQLRRRRTRHFSGRFVSLIFFSLSASLSLSPVWSVFRVQR